jgi:hypothetical protein
MRRLLSVLLVAMVTLGTLSGAGAAATTAIIDDSTEITQDSQTVWVDAEAVADLNGSTFNATVVIEGLASGETAGNGTVLSNQSASIATNGGATTVTYDLTEGDLDAYDKVHVTMSPDTIDDPDLLNSSAFGTTERLAGGGGASSGGNSILYLVGAVAIGGYLMVKD